ncbi:MAG: ABC transporter substrate-binding protein [Candidatus Limivivens sp.]|nr:ABC transporter substrate-binding protein [Candidatus Limivivens sp.]
MKKRILAGTVATLMLTMAASSLAFAAEGEEKVTLSFCWWGNQTRNDVTKKAVDLYMEQNPNVEIKVEFTDWTGYWDKLSTMAAGGNLPDIMQQDASYMNSYQSSGMLASLSEFIDSGVIDTSKINASVIESSTIDGNCYGISSGVTALMMDYDKEIVEQAGVEIPEQMTFDEFYDISAEIYEKTGAMTYFDGGMNTLRYLARSNGNVLYDEINAGDSTTVKEHFELVDKFAKAEFSITPELLAEKNPYVVETKPILDGTTWNDFSYCNQFISISNAAGRELEITMYPSKEEMKAQPMYLQPAAFLSVAETSEHKEEAAKFINWFVNSVECNEILMAERGIPVNSDVSEAIKPNADETFQKVFDYVAVVSEVAESIDPLEPAGRAEVDALLNTTVENLRYGDITVEEATESFMTDARRILEEAAK